MPDEALLALTALWEREMVLLLGEEVPPSFHIWRAVGRWEDDMAIRSRSQGALRLVGAVLLASSFLVSCAAPGPKPKPPQYDAFQISDEPEREEASDELPRKPSKDDRFQIPNSVVVCSWNIKWFGRSPVSKYDFVTMADFVEECDVVAIQELQDPNCTAVIDALQKELTNRGLDYDHRISDNTGYKNNPDSTKNDYLERYAFLWSANTLDLKGPPQFVSTPAINNAIYRQVPYVADFVVTNDKGFDFRVLSTHTVYNKALNAVRKSEIQAIHNWITTMPADGEENLIAIGDFNANPSGQPHHFAAIVMTNSLYRIPWYESAAAGESSVRTTVPQNESSADPNYQKLPVYDHALISSETSYALSGNPMTLSDNHFGVWAFDNDPWWEAHGWERNDIISAVSDHRPIWIRLISGAEDLDPRPTPQ